MDLIQRHGELSEALAEAIRDLAEVRKRITENRSAAWFANSHLPVTERKETVHASIVEHTAQAEELSGEVEALRVELAHIAIQITHG